MLNNDNSDKFFKENISEHLSSYTICIVTQNNTYMVIHKLDEENDTHLDIDKNNIYFFNTKEELTDILEEVFDDIHFPNNISLSYSTMGDANTDIISHGKYIFITKLIKGVYSKYEKKVKFDSAEYIIYDILAKKSDKELERLKLIASITDRILEETFKHIKIGYTELDIANLTQKCSNDIMKLYVGSNDIVSYDMAWENCPIVLTGQNLEKGGHSLPSDKKLQKGDTIYFDFGIKVDFKDNTSLYTDMQRMGYALKDQTVPKEVEKVFDTLVSAIEDGIDEMRPDIKGYEIDEIVRGKILKEGYPDYPHATGHPVGRNVHDIGAIISVRGSKRSKMKLVENGVYTLEPRINIPNGGSIEEMIQVTKYGGIPLCNTQKKLYIVK
ncbi:MAG: M24 family metallopeptidase [Clostridia bacterium]|nr:M24 family metallopeptidase [Clostridia bacterium]